MSHKRKPEGILYHPAYGRVMVHKRFSLSIHWSEAMIAYLRKHYPTTINSELAECFNMSSKTMIRKAQSLGLKKDPEWLLQLKRDNVRIAKAANKRKGWPGRFKKGQHANPAGEFGSFLMTPEEKERRREQQRQWYRDHPTEARRKAVKGWITRRANANSNT